MLTENQKRCKHEWYSKLHPHQFRKGIDHDFCSKEDCVVYRRDWEAYQQGLDDRTDEAIKLVELRRWTFAPHVESERIKHNNDINNLKSALMKLKETKT